MALETILFWWVLVNKDEKQGLLNFGLHFYGNILFYLKMDQNKPIMKYQKTIIFQIEKIMEHIKYDFQTLIVPQ